MTSHLRLPGSLFFYFFCIVESCAVLYLYCFLLWDSSYFHYYITSMYPPHSGAWCLVHCSLCTFDYVFCRTYPSCSLHFFSSSMSSLHLLCPSLLSSLASSYMLSLPHHLSDFFLSPASAYLSPSPCSSSLASLSSLLSSSATLSFPLSYCLWLLISPPILNLSLPVPSLSLAADTSAFYLLLCHLSPIILDERCSSASLLLSSSFPRLLQTAKTQGRTLGIASWLS